MVGQFFGCILLVKGSAGGLCFLLPGGTSLWPHCDRARRLTHRSIEPLPTPFFWCPVLTRNCFLELEFSHRDLVIFPFSDSIPLNKLNWFIFHSFIYIYIFHDFPWFSYDFPWFSLNTLGEFPWIRWRFSPRYTDYSKYVKGQGHQAAVQGIWLWF